MLTARVKALFSAATMQDLAPQRVRRIPVRESLLARVIYSQCWRGLVHWRRGIPVCAGSCDSLSPKARRPETEKRGRGETSSDGV